jgi:hypothetical protein
MKISVVVIAEVDVIWVFVLGESQQAVSVVLQHELVCSVEQQADSEGSQQDESSEQQAADS